MQRIIIHWTAGAHEPNGLDLSHYHFVIAGDGRVLTGKHPVAANRAPLTQGAYAAHTLNCNSGSIGVAFAAMRGAVERPFKAGPEPITEAQLAAMITLCQRLCREHSIPVSPETVLSHAEVQGTLGIAQRGKWDVTWLPDMAAPASARSVGDRLRASIAAKGKVEAGPRKGSTRERRVPECRSMFESLRAILRGLWSPMG